MRVTSLLLCEMSVVINGRKIRSLHGVAQLWLLIHTTSLFSIRNEAGGGWLIAF